LQSLLEDPIVQKFDKSLKEFAESQKNESDEIEAARNFLQTSQNRRQSLRLAIIAELVEAHLKVKKLSKKEKEKVGYKIRLKYKEIPQGWFDDLDQYYLSKIQNLAQSVDLINEAGEFYRRLDEVRNIEMLAHAVQFSETVSKKDYFSGVSYLMYEINRIQLTFVVPEAIETINNQFDMLEKSFHAAKTLLKNNGPIKNFFNSWVRKMNPNSNLNTEQRYAEQIKTILENIRKDLDSLQKIIKSHETLEIFKDTQFERYFYEKLDSKILKKIRNLEKGFDHYENELEKLNRLIRQKVK